MNDRISSIRVDSGRYGRYERATEIVRRACESVLNREPDPASQGYVDRVMREGWSEEDVARELRRSPEYRQAHPR